MSTYQPMPKLANLAIPFPSDEPEDEKRTLNNMHEPWMILGQMKPHVCIGSL
ncbi:hypothetical protein [Rhodopirellula bahusiensis]|uniref:hypothetical protein n=1 Tax=Rhodopirellula bahusiensis TaxID=2014065 RepID=UPI0032977B1E